MALAGRRYVNRTGVEVIVMRGGAGVLKDDDPPLAPRDDRDFDSCPSSAVGFDGLLTAAGYIANVPPDGTQRWWRGR